MEEPEVIPRTLQEKVLFYTTAFFVLLGTFSLFAFLFLVPFVIDPAFTTIFMQFDVEPAWCETVHTVTRKGASNCSWSSCREGCTKEVYECTQIKVNYRLAAFGRVDDDDDVEDVEDDDVVLHQGDDAKASVAGRRVQGAAARRSEPDGRRRERGGSSMGTAVGGGYGGGGARVAHEGGEEGESEGEGRRRENGSSSMGTAVGGGYGGEEGGRGRIGHDSGEEGEGEGEGRRREKDGSSMGTAVSGGYRGGAAGPAHDSVRDNDAEAKAKRSTASVELTSSTPPDDEMDATPGDPRRVKRALRNYDYLDKSEVGELEDEDREGADADVLLLEDGDGDEDGDMVLPTGLMGNTSKWYYAGAKLFPNVKGCGYPPMLNCSVFWKLYETVGTNFSCYYSKVDPGLVITSLDMQQVYMNLVYAMAIPIPSFIISVIYLTFAYFVIYSEEEEETALVGGDDGDAPDDDDDDDGGGDDGDGEGRRRQPRASDVAVPTNTTASGGMTPASDTLRDDLAAFGYQVKVAMVDALSRESRGSVDDAVSVSTSLPGNLNRTMTTSISTPAGPIAEL